MFEAFGPFFVVTQTEYILLFVTVGLAIWLTVITFVLFKTVAHYKRLLGSDNKADLKKVLDRILESEQESRKDIKKIYSWLEETEKDGRRHIQKIGLVRYNPFADTGGDHSFSLALLDGNKNGFVVTSLHARERSRFYVKSVKAGQGSRDLSREEERAIEVAAKS